MTDIKNQQVKYTLKKQHQPESIAMYVFILLFFFTFSLATLFVAQRCFGVETTFHPHQVMDRN